LSRWLKPGLYTVAVICLLVALIYAGDYLVLRVRIARSSGYDTVTVRQYYAINEKNNRTEYVFGSTQDQSCVNSLFGHQGLQPCWYLRRHPEQQTQI
jgi:hypothetical protein